MLIARTPEPHGLRHGIFTDLPVELTAGDLLVVNTSATVPSALDATLDGRPVVVHTSAPHSPPQPVG